jgi:hypothetical protein
VIRGIEVTHITIYNCSRRPDKKIPQGQIAVSNCVHVGVETIEKCLNIIWILEHQP